MAHYRLVPLCSSNLVCKLPIVGFILETVRMKGIGVLRYRISGIELRYRFHPMFIYCICHYNVYVGVQKIFILNVTVGEYFVWIMTEG